MFDLKKRDGENEEKYIFRLGQAKDSGLIDMDWTELADIINKECRNDESEYRTEAAYRRIPMPKGITKLESLEITKITTLILRNYRDKNRRYRKKRENFLTKGLISIGRCVRKHDLKQPLKK